MKGSVLEDYFNLLINMGFWLKKKKNTINNDLDVTPEERQLAEEERIREKNEKHQKIREKNEMAVNKQQAQANHSKGLDTTGITNAEVLNTRENKEEIKPTQAVILKNNNEKTENNKTIGDSNIPAKDFNNSEKSKNKGSATTEPVSNSFAINSESNTLVNSDSKVSLTSMIQSEKEYSQSQININNNESKEDLNNMNNTTIINAQQSNHLRLIPSDDKSQTIFEVDAAFADWFVNDVISSDKDNHIEDIEGHKNEAISYLTSVYLLTSGYTSNNTNTKTLDNGGFLTEYKEYIHDNIYYLIQSILAYDGTEEMPMGTTWKIVNTSEYLHKLALMAFEGPEVAAKKHKDYMRAVNNFIKTVGNGDISINYIDNLSKEND